MGIRFGVEVLPPFVLGAVRYLLSGVLMLVYCRVRGINLRLTGREALDHSGRPHPGDFLG